MNVCLFKGSEPFVVITSAAGGTEEHGVHTHVRTLLSTGWEFEMVKTTETQDPSLTSQALQDTARSCLLMWDYCCRHMSPFFLNIIWKHHEHPIWNQYVQRETNPAFVFIPQFPYTLILSRHETVWTIFLSIN